jgi:hypothetical protein
MKIKPGQVWVYTDENGMRMKRLILHVDDRTWTSRIILCEYERKYEGETDVLDNDNPLDETWKQDEVNEVELILKDYEM